MNRQQRRSRLRRAAFSILADIPNMPRSERRRLALAQARFFYRHGIHI